MPAQTKTEPQTPKRCRSSTQQSPTVHSNPAITSMNGNSRLVREKNAIPLLCKPVLMCTCPINKIYAMTSRQKTTNIWTMCTWPTLTQSTVHSLGRNTVVMCTMRVSSSSCGSLEAIARVGVPNKAVLATRRDVRTSTT